MSETLEKKVRYAFTRHWANMDEGSHDADAVAILAEGLLYEIAREVDALKAKRS